MRGTRGPWITFAFAVVLGVGGIHLYRSNSSQEGKAPPAQGDSPPLLLIDRIEFSTADAIQGERVESEPVLLRNIGGSLLTIDQIQAGCRCVPIAVETPLRIAAGEEIEIRFEVDTSTKKGPFRIPVLISSDASNAPRQEIFIVGNVEPALTLKPEWIHLGTLELSGGRAQFTIGVRLARSASPDSLSISYLPLEIEELSHALDEEMNLYQYRFAIRSDSPVTLVEDKIEFTVQSKGTVVRASAEIMAKVFRDYWLVEPYPVSLGALPVGELRRTTCRIRFQEEPSSLVILSTHEVVESAQLLREKDAAFRLTVHTRMRNRGALSNSAITLAAEFADGREQTIEIPIVGLAY